MKNNQKVNKKCENCGRDVFGFLKYGQHPVCSMKCFRILIKDKKIPMLDQSRAHPELGISAPRNESFKVGVFQAVDIRKV